MSVIRRCFRIAGATVVVLAVLALGILYLPPWWGKWAYMSHVLTGIPYGFGWPPKTLTGTWVEYGKGGLRREFSYVEGERHGVQNHYDAKGALLRTCEFRSDRPWSGYCEFWEHKPWLAEFREGKVWTGAMTEFDHELRSYVKRCYYKGETYNQSEFRRLMGFDEEGSLIGVHCVVAEKTP